MWFNVIKKKIISWPLKLIMNNNVIIVGKLKCIINISIINIFYVILQ